jgi:uncharacterized protein involved in exopolysaccharide biosynthesis
MDEPLQENMENESGLLDYLLVLAKRLKLIVRVTFSIAFLALIYSLILPKEYEAVARIYPSQQGTPSISAMIMNQVSSAMGGLGGGLLGGFGAGTTSDVCSDMLKGDTIADAIIDRFHLMEVFHTATRLHTRKQLSTIVHVKSDRQSGIISITVTDEEPQRAANMANAFVEELTKLNTKLAITNASQRRLFYEIQLKDASEALARAEESVKEFMETTGAIRIEGQAGAIFEGIAALRAQTAAKEIQLKVMKTYATPFNRDVKQAEEELAGIREQLKNLEAKGSAHYGNTVIPTDQIPALGTEYLRKYREFKFQEVLFELLSKQYEAARLDEANNVTTIQVIDSATVPDYKARPKRASIVIAATMVGFFFSIILVFFSEYWEKQKENQDFQEKHVKLTEYLAPITHNRAIMKICQVCNSVSQRLRRS